MCYPSGTWRINSAKPVIAQVCYEARQVVHKHGCWLKDWLPPRSDSRWTVDGEPGYLGQIYRNENGHVWCSPDIDSLHLNYGWPSMYETWLYYLPKQPMQLLESCRGTAKHLSVDFDRFHVFGQTSNSAYIKELLYFQPGERYQAVMKQCCIHMSAEDLAPSGLFGKGDERVVMLDVLETSMIASYVQLLYGSCSKFNKSEVEFLNKIVDIGRMLEMTKRWHLEMTKLWVWARWIEKGGLHFFDEACPFLPRERAYPIHSPQLYVDYSQKLFAEDLNLDDPWVSEVVSQMPIFTPTIIFRFCESTKCEQVLEEVPVYRNSWEAIKLVSRTAQMLVAKPVN